MSVVLADDTTFSMAENGSMVLDEMVYDPATLEGSISLSVSEGIFTFVSGEVAKTDPESMLIETPVATVGIRGTQAGLNVGAEETVVVLMEEADGFVGEVVVTNRAGVQVINVAEDGVTVTSAGTAPTAPVHFQRGLLLKTFGGALDSLPTGHNANKYGLEEASIEPWTSMRTTVRPGHYFVLGDNRKRSSDSREFGQVPFEYLRGKVRLRLWPMDRAGLIH